MQLQENNFVFNSAQLMNLVMLTLSFSAAWGLCKYLHHGYSGPVRAEHCVFEKRSSSAHLLVCSSARLLKFTSAHLLLCLNIHLIICSPVNKCTSTHTVCSNLFCSFDNTVQISCMSAHLSSDHLFDCKCAHLPNVQISSVHLQRFFKCSSAQLFNCLSAYLFIFPFVHLLINITNTFIRSSANVRQTTQLCHLLQFFPL